MKKFKCIMISNFDEHKIESAINKFSETVDEVIDFAITSTANHATILIYYKNIL